MADEAIYLERNLCQEAGDADEMVRLFGDSIVLTFMLKTVKSCRLLFHRRKTLSIKSDDVLLIYCFLFGRAESKCCWKQDKTSTAEKKCWHWLMTQSVFLTDKKCRP